MTDGPGSTPDVPSGWAAEQPPPYGGPGGIWASPTGPGGPPPPPGGPGPGAAGPYQQNPYPPAPYAPGPYAYGPPDAPRPGIIPLRPLALGDILDGTIKLIRSNPVAALGLSAIVAAITSIPNVLVQVFSFRALGEFMADPYAADVVDVPLAGEASQLVATVVGYVTTFVGTTVLTGILTRVLGRAVFGGRITVGEAWRLARPRMPALFGLVLLQALILLLPLLVFIAVIMGLVTGLVLTGPSGTTAGAAVVVFLLFLLGYIPYLLFFYTRLLLAAPAIMLEGRGVTEAMSRSWRLVQGDSWRVLGILLLTSLLAAVIGAVLAVPFTFGGSLLAVTNGGNIAGAAVAAALLTIGGIITAMLTYPFQAGVTGLLYADRRMRAEAFDLVLQTAATQNQAQGWVHAGVDDLWHPSHAAGTGPGSPPYYGAPPYGPYGPYGPQA